jgi:hypothetical protein
MRTLRYSAALTAAALQVTCAAVWLPAGIASASDRLWRAVRVELPPNAAKNGESYLQAMDCVSAGACTAGGAYALSARRGAPMVASSSDGRWARAREIRLPAAARSTGGAVNSVDCGAIGSCVAVGYYYAGGGVHDFVAVESRGHWTPAHGIAPPSTAEYSELYGVSCTGPGSCEAVGLYAARSGIVPMAVTESGGKWARARQIRQPSNAGAGIFGPVAVLSSVSCERAGSCTAIGSYTNKLGAEKMMGVTESGGRWERATQIRLPSGADPASVNGLASVSCTGAGSCTAVGLYYTHAPLGFPMAATQAGGRWARARTVAVLPVNVSRQPFREASLLSISCPHAGSCTALGNYTDKTGGTATMIAIESDARWVTADEIHLPANAKPGQADTEAGALDCTKSGYCAADGSYTDRSGIEEAMIASPRSDRR